VKVPFHDKTHSGNLINSSVLPGEEDLNVFILS